MTFFSTEFTHQIKALEFALNMIGDLDVSWKLIALCGEAQQFLFFSLWYQIKSLKYVCALTSFPGGGGGVHNMLRVWVCAAHMGGFLGPKFSKQGSLCSRFSINMDELSRNVRKIAKYGLFSAKIHHKSGYRGVH